MKSHLGTRYLIAVCATVFLAAPSLAQSRGQRGRRPPDQFATVNGVRLHYLDWGGHGNVLLFLAGLGDSAHRFDSFAPRFLDASTRSVSHAAVKRNPRSRRRATIFARSRMTFGRSWT